jgi:hypothetical protein
VKRNWKLSIQSFLIFVGWIIVFGYGELCSYSNELNNEVAVPKFSTVRLVFGGTQLDQYYIAI